MPEGPKPKTVAVNLTEGFSRQLLDQTKARLAAQPTLDAQTVFLQELQTLITQQGGISPLTASLSTDTNFHVIVNSGN